jgi:hypothetical protein
MSYSRLSLCHISPDSLGTEGTAEPLSLVCLGSSFIVRMDLPELETESGTGREAMTEVTPYWIERPLQS